MSESWYVVAAVALAPFAVATLSWAGFTLATRLRNRRQLMRSFRSVMSTRRRLARRVASVVALWVAVTAALTPVSPALAVWAGGAVVVTGAWLAAATRPAVVFDDSELDLELRALIDELT